jgi:hypothetical protein
VDFFRQLLAMTPDERDTFLTNRPPEIRARILAKVGEYEALNPDERELRLRATELRWYLMPLLRAAPANRAARLAQVPADIRELVQDRLEEWSILPPPLQQEFLENERILRYFAHLDASNNPSENFWREPDAADRAHWNTLSEAERRQVTAGFNQFFELTPDEKQKTLGTLSEAERGQMEKTLLAFEKMPAAQRAECVSAFAKFASMNPQQQARVFEKRRALVGNVARRTPDLARPGRQRAAMAAAAGRLRDADTGRGQSRRGHEPQLKGRISNSPFRRAALNFHRASDCVSSRFVPGPFLWRDDRARVPRRTVDGHAPRPPGKHFR